MPEIKRDPARDISEVEWGIAKSTFTDLIERKKGILETDVLTFVTTIGGTLPERAKGFWSRAIIHKISISLVIDIVQVSLA